MKTTKSNGRAIVYGENGFINESPNSPKSENTKNVQKSKEKQS
jgi:hypothetical protein